MASTRLTDSERVLLAIRKASSDARAPVPYEEIVIASWELFPDRFSLRNHPEYPDSADQHKRLYGDLQKRGYVEVLRDKYFRITSAGLERAHELELGDMPASEASDRLSRDDERLVRRALGSAAFAKWKGGKSQEIVDFDVRALVGITVRTPARDRLSRTAALAQAVERAAERSMDSASDLHRMLGELLSRYGHELDLIHRDSRVLGRADGQ